MGGNMPIPKTYKEGDIVQLKYDYQGVIKDSFGVVSGVRDNVLLVKFVGETVSKVIPKSLLK